MKQQKRLECKLNLDHLNTFAGKERNNLYGNLEFIFFLSQSFRAVFAVQSPATCYFSSTLSQQCQPSQKAFELRRIMYDINTGLFIVG